MEALRCHWLNFLLPSLLSAYACNGPVEPDVEIPFDPTGTWERTVQGQLRDSLFTGPLLIHLEILGEPFQLPGGPFLLVELRGSWEWGGITGLVEGFWETPDRPDLSNGGCANGILTQCSLGFSLEAPWPDYCAEPSDIGLYVPIIVYGWFESASRIVTPHLRGQYWQGYYTDAFPCAQPTLVGFDTSIELARR